MHVKRQSSPNCRRLPPGTPSWPPTPLPQHRTRSPGLPNPTRVIGHHFFSPANVMKLLEIVPAARRRPPRPRHRLRPRRPPEEDPVQAGICDGFIGNRILKRYRAAAETLVRDGVPSQPWTPRCAPTASPWAPSRRRTSAASTSPPARSRAGPGRDRPRDPRRHPRPRRPQGPEDRRRLVRLRPRRPHPAPVAAVAALLSSPPAATPPDIADHLVAEMAAEGRAILAEGIAAQPADIDLVEIHGYGFLAAAAARCSLPALSQLRLTTP